MKLYYHPISTYSRKVLIAFHEKQVSFEPCIVKLMDPAAKEEYKKIHPLGKVPLLVRDDGWMIPESSIIIEFLDGQFSSGTKLIPDDKDLARQVRFFDRMSDLYIDEPAVTLFFQGMRPEGQKVAELVTKAKSTLDLMYPVMDKHMEKKTWIMGNSFTMADCSAAPALSAARMVAPFDKFPNLMSYWNRLSERPSVQKVEKEAAAIMAQMMPTAKK